MKAFLLFGCLVTIPFDETMYQLYLQCSKGYCHKQGLGCYEEKWGKIMACTARLGERLLKKFDCPENEEQ